MKSRHLFLIAMLVSQISLASNIIKGSAPITSALNFALMNAEVACIVKVHPENEGGESDAELFFMNVSEYASYQNLTEGGYALLNELKGGAKCQAVRGSMKLVYVGLFDSAAEIKKAIADQKASLKSTVVLVKMSQVLLDVKSQQEAVIKELLR